MLLHILHWALDSRTTSAALASDSEAGGLQDGHLGLPVAVRHGFGLPGRCQLVSEEVCRKLHSADSRTGRPTAALETIFHGYRPKAVEQPSSWS